MGASLLVPTLGCLPWLESPSMVVVHHPSPFRVRRTLAKPSSLSHPNTLLSICWTHTILERGLVVVLPSDPPPPNNSPLKSHFPIFLGTCDFGDTGDCTCHLCSYVPACLFNWLCTLQMFRIPNAALNAVGGYLLPMSNGEMEILRSSFHLDWGGGGNWCLSPSI